MAITKEYIYSTTPTTAASNICTFLQQYAAEYFDSFSLSEDGLSVLCYVGSDLFLEITVGISSQSSVSFKNTAITNSYNPWTYGYACEGGVSFSNADGVALTITKDASGETVVIAAGNLDANIGITSTATVYVASPSSPASDTIPVPNHTTSDGMTVVTPFVVPKAMPSFTPNVSILTYSQHVSGTGSAVLDIDGTDWLSTGLWAVKDSANGGSGSADMSAYALKSEVNTEAQNRIAADTALQESITALDAKIEQKYITLVSGDDLNTITAQNRYRSPSGAVTKAIANVPEVVGNNGFGLDVYTTASYPFYVQEITWCGYSTFLVNKIVRCGRSVDGAIQWGEWYQYGLAMVGEATE